MHQYRYRYPLRCWSFLVSAVSLLSCFRCHSRMLPVSLPHIAVNNTTVTAVAGTPDSTAAEICSVNVTFLFAQPQFSDPFLVLLEYPNIESPDLASHTFWKSDLAKQQFVCADSCICFQNHESSLATPLAVPKTVASDSSSIVQIRIDPDNFILVNLSSIRNRKPLQALFSLDVVIKLVNDTDGNVLSNRRQVDRLFKLRIGDDIDEVSHRWVNRSLPAYLYTHPAGLEAVLSEIRRHIYEGRQYKRMMMQAAQDAIMDTRRMFSSLNIGVGELTTSFNEMVTAQRLGRSPFLALDYHTLDATSADDWRQLFLDSGIIDNVKMEHILEHLSLPEALVAFEHCLHYLKPGGRLRIAIPDYHWMRHYDCPLDTDHDCQQAILAEDVRDRHMVRYTLASLTVLLSAVGFHHIQPLEWTDSQGVVHHNTWSLDDGPIERSSKGAENNTRSLVIDAFKALAINEYEPNQAGSVGSVVVDFATDCVVKELFAYVIQQSLALVISEIQRFQGRHIKVALWNPMLTESPCRYDPSVSETLKSIASLHEWHYIDSSNWIAEAPSSTVFIVAVDSSLKQKDTIGLKTVAILLRDLDYISNTSALIASPVSCSDGTGHTCRNVEIISPLPIPPFFDRIGSLGYNPFDFHMSSEADIDRFRKESLSQLYNVKESNITVSMPFLVLLNDATEMHLDSCRGSRKTDHTQFLERYAWILQAMANGLSTVNENKFWLFVIGGRLTIEDTDYLNQLNIQWCHLAGSIPPHNLRVIYSTATAVINMPLSVQVREYCSWRTDVFSLVSNVQVMACGSPLVTMLTPGMNALVENAYKNDSNRIVFLLNSSTEGYELWQTLRLLIKCGHGQQVNNNEPFNHQVIALREQLAHRTRMSLVGWKGFAESMVKTIV